MKKISLKNFIEDNIGKYISFKDTDKLKTECVTLIQEYIRQCYDIPFKARGNAKDWANSCNDIATKTDKPVYGDIIVWGANATNSGYGHLAIYIDGNKYFDQYTGKMSGYSTDSVKNVKPIAYLRLKGTRPADKTVLEVAMEVIDGKWGNYPKRKELLEKDGYNYKEVQDIVNELIDQDKKKLVIKVGDKVKVINKIQYNGKPFKAYYDIYDVLEVKDDRVVIGIEKAVTAAVNIKDIKKI